jgi:GntR family transcriptional regulator
MLLGKGEFHPDGKLPPEEELTEVFGVSRTTIRTALEHLLNKGYISRKRGSGTFLTEKAIKESAGKKLSGLNRQIFNINEETSVKVLSKLVRPGSDEVLDFLKLNDGSDVAVFERIRFVKNKPLSYTINFMSVEYGSPIEKSDLVHATMLETIESVLKIKLGTVEHQIEITRANNEISKNLMIPVLDPVLTVVTSVYDTLAKPVEIAWTYFVEDKYKFRVVLDGNVC